MRNPFTFDQLNAQVDQMQRRILSAIWQHYLETKQWTLTRRLHRDFGKETVQKSLKPLGGTIVREILDSGNYRYEITLLGILLTEQGEVLEGLLARYLEYLRDRFEAQPECESVKSQEVEAALNLSPDQSRLLGKLIWHSPFQGGGNFSDTHWDFRFPNNIDDFPSITDFRGYIRERLMEQYDPAIPVDERGRMLYSISQPDEKQREQKFGILLSPGQAVLDFQGWGNEFRDTGNPMAMFFVDIDKFKKLNSRYTEAKIDKTILPDAQHLLARLVHLRGEAYRVGGDEFVLILPNHTLSEAMAFGERLRLAFEEHPFSVDGAQEQLTVSGGLALWPQHGDTYDEVYSAANSANKEAKASRNTIKVAILSVGKSLPLPGSGLSENAQRLAALLNQRSQTGRDYDPMLQANDALSALGLPEEEVALAADELEERGWVELLKTNAMGKVGFTEISPKPKLFFETDPILKGWTPRDDAKVLANTLIDTGGAQIVNLPEVDRSLNWGPRRLNPAAQFLAVNQYVKPDEGMGTHPYVYGELIVTARTKRFARES